MGVYPCLDELRRYRAFPCSQCTATSCWTGKKPQAPAPKLQPGQRACGHCGQPYRSHGRAVYCSETCRYTAMMARRRDRARGSQRGGQGRIKTGYASRNQHGSFWVSP